MSVDCECRYAASTRVGNANKGSLNSRHNVASVSHPGLKLEHGGEYCASRSWTRRGTDVSKPPSHRKNNYSSPRRPKVDRDHVIPFWFASLHL